MNEKPFTFEDWLKMTEKFHPEIVKAVREVQNNRKLTIEEIRELAKKII